MMWFAIQTADAPSPLVSITATWTESSLQGPADTYSFASLSFFPHEQHALDFFYPTESAACPLAPSFFSLSTHTSSLILFNFFFVTIMPLLSCCTTVPLYLPLSSLPGGIYQAAGAGRLQHRLCQPTLWTWDQEEEGEKDVWILMSLLRTQVRTYTETHTQPMLSLI